MIMIILELMLGVAILIYWRMNLTAWLLLLMMTFFTFLTFTRPILIKLPIVAALAMPLNLLRGSPSERCYSNGVCGTYILVQENYKPVLSARVGYTLIASTVLVSLLVGVYAIRHLPFLDFRAYRIGNNIPQQMIPQSNPLLNICLLKMGKKCGILNF